VPPNTREATQLTKEDQERSDIIDGQYDGLDFFGMDADAIKNSEGGSDILISILQDASICGARVI
jgi:hypothetical protein